jgi:hypothetical protein
MIETCPTNIFNTESVNAPPQTLTLPAETLGNVFSIIPKRLLAEKAAVACLIHALECDTSAITRDPEGPNSLVEALRLASYSGGDYDMWGSIRDHVRTQGRVGSIVSNPSQFDRNPSVEIVYSGRTNKDKVYKRASVEHLSSGNIRYRILYSANRPDGLRNISETYTLGAEDGRIRDFTYSEKDPLTNRSSSVREVYWMKPQEDGQPAAMISFTKKRNGEDSGAGGFRIGKAFSQRPNRLTLCPHGENSKGHLRSRMTDPEMIAKVPFPVFRKYDKANLQCNGETEG